VTQPKGIPAWLKSIEWCGEADAQLCVKPNKGLPLQPYQEQYVDAENVWIAEKKDGISAKLVYSHKSFTIVAPGAEVFKIRMGNNLDASWTGPDFLCFILMVELVPAMSGSGHATRTGVPYWIVVTDVLVAPWGESGSFIARWKWLEDVYSRGTWPFVLQKWFNLRDPDVLVMLDLATEGVVIQNLLASPGAIKQGAGSAMYVKRKYTIDKRIHDGTVAEFDLNDRYIRPRPDKTHGNPQSVIDKIKRAVNYDVFCLYILTKYYATLGADWATLLENMRLRVPVKEWPNEQKLLFFANRHDVKLHRVFPELMRALVTQFALHCVDSSKVTPESWSVDYSQDEDEPIYADFEEPIIVEKRVVIDLKPPLEGFSDLYEDYKNNYPTRGLFPCELNNYVGSVLTLQELTEKLIK